MTQHHIINEYFEWMCNLVCGDRDNYRKLFMALHNTEFTYLIDMDENRAEDGMDLRWRFVLERGYEDHYSALVGPCSVLEMMVALAIRCEDVMDDPDIGNRTDKWFWTMIFNLGLDSMDDERFDRDYVSERIDIFLNREYASNGEGGLFVIEGCEDLRDVEIWYQLCWYMDSIL